MRMNKILSLYGFSLAAISLFGCSEWLEYESVNNTDLNATTKTEEYYAALRKWKQTPDLPQVFVWFDGWAGTSPTGQNSLRGLPDSVTIASNWGNPKFELSDAQKEDMAYVQRVKGTKVVFTLFAQKIGDNVEHQDIFDTAPAESKDEAVIRPAIKAYARALYDACIASGYDGFDWDYEQSGTNITNKPLWENPFHRAIFIEELSFWFGNGAMDTTRDRGDRPLPEKRLLFLIDGNVSGLALKKEKDEITPRDFFVHYVDYYVLQTYGRDMVSLLQSRVTSVIKSLAHWVEDGLLTNEEIVKRTFVTENFESHAGTGGGFLVMSKLLHQADGVDRQIGGCGIYRIGFDYNQGKGDYQGSPEYYFLRQGITNIYNIFRERQNLAPEEDNGEEKKDE